MKNLTHRFLSASVLITLFIALIIFDVPIVIILGAVAFAFWGSVEFYDIVQQKGLKASKWYGTISNAIIIIAVCIFSVKWGDAAVSMLPWVFLLCAIGAFVRQLFVNTPITLYLVFYDYSGNFLYRISFQFSCSVKILPVA